MKDQTSNSKPTVASLPIYFPIVVIVLSFLAIISTSLPNEIQQYPSALGFPLILWFWLVVTALLAVLTIGMAWKVISRA